MVPVRLLQAYEQVFPIFTGPSVMNPTGIAGTAFPITPTVFATAAHCLKSGMEAGWMALGRLQGKNWKVFHIGKWELVDGLDVGLFEVDVPHASETVRWTREELFMGAEVSSCGFAYGFDSEHKTADIRGFFGRIVSGRAWQRMPARPAIYELSFMCPRGLSGAPVWMSVPNDQPYVVGIVLGNEITEMTVHSSKETDHDTGAVTVYEKTEALHLGIAIRTAEILPLRPKLLGGKSVEDVLRATGGLRY